MKKSWTLLLAALTVIMTVLSGCGSAKFEPTGSSIYVKKDGTVISADIEDFSGSNYSEDELKAYVENAVKSYNSEKGAASEAYADKNTSLPVAVDSLTVKDNTASLYLSYATCADYLEFTGTGGMEDGISALEKATIAEMSLSGNFKNAKNENVTLDSVTKNSKYHVVRIEGPVTMQIEGKVAFVSAGVTIDSKNTVTTPEADVSYIVFK